MLQLIRIFLLLIAGLCKTCYFIHRQNLCIGTHTEFLINSTSHDSYQKYVVVIMYERSPIKTEDK